MVRVVVAINNEEEEEDEEGVLPLAAEVDARAPEAEGLANLDESEVVPALDDMLDISAYVPVEPPLPQLPPEPAKRVLKRDQLALEKAKAKEEAKAKEDKKQKGFDLRESGDGI